MLKIKVTKTSEIISKVSIERFEKVEEIKVGNDFNYQHAVMKQTKLYKKLYQSIPKECRQILREFEEISSYKGYVEARLMYKQGMNDGVALSKIIGGAKL